MSVSRGLLGARLWRGEIVPTLLSLSLHRPTEYQQPGQQEAHLQDQDSPRGTIRILHDGEELGDERSGSVLTTGPR